MSAAAPPSSADMPQSDMLQSPPSTMSANMDSNQTAPTANGNSLKDSIVNNTAAATNAVSNHPVTQNTKEALTKGPVAESVKNETAKTSNEFSGLANSRVASSNSAATGQPLTHYHSFFYTLLSWEHPRATAISFATSVIFIFLSRYLPLLRWAFKITYLAFGVTALAEVVGKSVMGTGVAASFRPRKYYRVPKETLETFLDDIEQLINFFVIEFQRILFAENVAVTVVAFLSAFVSYYLIKILPFWGLTLLSTCVIYLAPLIYISNKEAIDGQLEHASTVVSAQTAQLKGIAGERTSKGFESVKQYTGDYAAKAQGMMSSARQKSSAVVGGQSPTHVKESQFPAAPKSEPLQEKAELNSAGGPIPAS